MAEADEALADADHGSFTISGIAIQFMGRRGRWYWKENYRSGCRILKS